MDDFKIGDRVAVRDQKDTLIGRIFDVDDATVAKRLGGLKFRVCSDNIYDGPGKFDWLKADKPKFVGVFKQSQLTLIPEPTT